MPRTDKRFTRFTLDMDPALHRRLRLYALTNGIHTAALVRSLISDFLEAKIAGDEAVDAANFRRGFEAGMAAERARIATAITSPSDAAPGEAPGPRPGLLPTSPPRPLPRTEGPAGISADGLPTVHTRMPPH